MTHPEHAADSPATRLATRLAFLVAGFGIACWGPLVPFVKQRLGIDDAMLGLLVLCIGLGAVCALPFIGMLCARYGSRVMIVIGGCGLSLLLPLLTILHTPLELGVALFAFGISIAALDISMNIHAVDVERASPKPLMSGFHALFSIGGFLGSLVMTALLSLNLGALFAGLLCAAPMLVAILLAKPRLMRAAHGKEGPLFVIPKGAVLVIAALAAISFLMEGALLDWSALLITDKGLMTAAHAGLGYVLFSITMTTGRLGGDRVVARIGDRATLFWGGLIAVAGFAILLLSPVALLAMSGFLLIGLGASNVVPVLFRLASAQHAMPTALAVAAVATTGYAGGLAGPAVLGFVAKHAGTPTAFWLLALLTAMICVGSRWVTSETSSAALGASGESA